jgi:AcrR family transcriptional regulator
VSGCLPQSGRLPHGMVRDRILKSAELLFAENGVESSSFREITAMADVSLSAIHYHFGTKQAVLAEIFAQHSRRLTQQRDALLRRVERDISGNPILESVLDAFLRPSFLPLQDESNELFNRLRARLSMESKEVTRTILRNAFDVSDQDFIETLALILPSLSRRTLHWRFHMMVGAMIYTMADTGQLEGLSGGLCSSGEKRAALDQIVAAFTTVFRAPEPA